MKNVIITQDVRFLGVGYSPGEDPVEVPDEVADELQKLGCAELPAESGEKPTGTDEA